LGQGASKHSLCRFGCLDEISEMASVINSMTNETASVFKQISEARLKANRANAQLAHGPVTSAGKARSSGNAVKHGLTARIAWSGQDAKRNREFFAFGWLCLGPQNPIEEICVANLLQNRLREDHLIDVERTLFLRQPVSHTLVEGQPYPFIQDPEALATLEQLTRHLTHISRAFEKELLALLCARKEKWAQPTEGNRVLPSWVDCGGTEAAGSVSEPDPSEVPPVNCGLLHDLLADFRVVFPGEDSDAYHALACELWATFQPANLLEGFVVVDFIQTQWRLDRALHLQTVLLEDSAVSASGHDCGFGFGFLHDCQRNCALEPLRHYEAALRKRLEKRMSLFHKLRENGWTDADAPDDLILPEPSPSVMPASTSSVEPIATVALTDQVPDSGAPESHCAGDHDSCTTLEHQNAGFDSSKNLI
jgi:hypothetical protein